MVTNEPEPGSIKLIAGDGKVAIEICPDGKFFVQGRETGMDKDVYKGFRKFLTDLGYC